MKEIIAKANTRSLAILILLVGSLGLAIADREYRQIFGDIAKVGLGGYLGQMLPSGAKQ